MAFDRKTFKDKLQDVLGGALTHYYMTRLAIHNKQSKWVRHWQNEIDRLIHMDMVRILVSHIKGTWDKRKALAESLADVRAADRGYRRVAANYVARVYSLKKVRQDLPDDVDADFYRMIQQAAEAALRPAEAESSDDPSPRRGTATAWRK
jgi:hypothetical protein